MMDGRMLMAGAVASVTHIANPISLARRVLHDSEHVFLVGAGAERFAAEAGIPLCEPAELVVERERRLWDERRRTNDEGRTTEDDRRAAFEAADRIGADAVGADTVGAVAIDAAGNRRWAIPPAAPASSIPAASATRRSSAAGCTPITRWARLPAPAGANRS